MEITNLKSAATLLTRDYIIQSLLGLLNEILCIFLAQGKAKIPKVKVWGPKKLSLSTFFSVICVFNPALSFAAVERQGYTISYLKVLANSCIVAV